MMIGNELSSGMISVEVVLPRRCGIQILLLKTKKIWRLG